MATSSVELVFGFKDGTTKKLTFSPFSNTDSSLTNLKSRIIAFNESYTANKWQYNINGSISDAEPSMPFIKTTYPLIVSKDGAELLDTAPIVEAYIITTARTDINLNA